MPDRGLDPAQQKELDRSLERFARWIARSKSQRLLIALVWTLLAWLIVGAVAAILIAYRPDQGGAAVFSTTVVDVLSAAILHLGVGPRGGPSSGAPLQPSQ